MPSPTDIKLIEAMNKGDTSAFDTLYLRHRDWVYRIALRFSADSADAQDATQEVFVYFLRQFPGFQLRCKLTTYLYPIARNTAITIQRKRSRMRLFGSVHEHPIEPAAPLDIESQTEEMRVLDAAIRRLGAERSEILLMRLVDEMSHEDIAQALGIPLGTSKSRLHRAIEDLRKDPEFRRSFGIDK